MTTRKAKDFTLWRKTMNRVVWGLLFSGITLNFAGLNYILPVIGGLVMILGLRVLRTENRGFQTCYVIAWLRMGVASFFLILNATIYRLPETVATGLSVLSLLLMCALFIFLEKGMTDVQNRAGLFSGGDSARGLLAWYVLLILLILVKMLSGLVMLVLLIGYGFLFRGLFRFVEAVEAAGFEIAAAKPVLSERALVRTIVLALCGAVACGYFFGGSYRMDWETHEPAGSAEVTAIRAELIDLGFPEAVLNDISREDILACEGAEQVYVEYGKSTQSEMEVVYAGVAVKIPDEKETWKLFHHFAYNENQYFIETEAIFLWPAYDTVYEEWDKSGEITGRVLYDKGEETLAAPYTAIDYESYRTLGNGVWEMGVILEFSMPKKGENYRGYLTYAVAGDEPENVIDSGIQLVHQTGWMQYPVETSKEARINGIYWDFQTFHIGLAFKPAEVK